MLSRTPIDTRTAATPFGVSRGIGHFLKCASSLYMAEERKGLAISTTVWDAFLKEALMAPSTRASKANMRTGTSGAGLGTPGKVKSAVTTSGKGQLTSLGRSGTSSLATPPPSMISP